jgi:pyridoxine kinase
MSLALILSSYVAASRVGGMAQALALAALGIEPVVAPTVLFGRHPGRGAPGGGVVSDEMFEGVLAGIEADGVLQRADALITGYFATPGQVSIAAGIIDTARAIGRARIIVDPIMGDAGRLYVSEAVARAIAKDLIPRADLLAPNAWELERLSGAAIADPPAAVEAARRLGKAVLVSSVPCDGAIGVVYADPAGAWLASHARAPSAPNGTGDLLTALFAAALIEGLSPELALARAVEAVAAAVAAGGAELAIVATGARLRQPTDDVRLERVS